MAYIIINMERQQSSVSVPAPRRRLVAISFRSLQADGDKYKRRDWNKRNLDQAIHFLHKWILFLMRLTFTSVMEPVVSLQKLKGEPLLATKSVDCFKIDGIEPPGKST